MSDDQDENKTETPTNDTDQTAPLKPEDVGEKWDHVKLNPEQQMRFNRMFKQVKRNETIIQQMIADNKSLVARLTELEAGNAEKEVKTAIAGLRKARIAAYENGDFAKVTEIEDQIEDLKEKNKQVEVEKKKALEQKDIPPEQLTPELHSRISDWVQEKDSEGNLLRPFANPRHPQHQQFMRIIEFTLTQPDIGDKDEDEVFAEVDKALTAFGLVKNKSSRIKQTVLPSLASDAPSKTEKPLTQEQRYIARKMFADAKDPEAEYRKALKDA